MSISIQQIKQRISKRIYKFNGDQIDVFLECFLTNSHLFRCFASDRQVYLYKINGKLEHIGEAKTVNQFALLIKSHLEN